ncbi:MAG: hypothetical protein ACXWPM_01160 [Bdellovibrionota bacterium]
MKNFTLALTLIAALAASVVSLEHNSFAAADSIVRNTGGFFAKRASDGKYYPAALCYSTDGSQALVPCREGGAGVSPGYLDTSSTNVLSSAYQGVISSTSDQAKAIAVYNGSSTSLSLAVASGGGAYVEKMLVSPSGWSPVMKLYIPAGASVGVKSKGSTVSSGVVLIDLVQ